MEKLLEFIIKSIVQTPEEVVIVKEELGAETKYSVQLKQEDIGIVIGQGGKTIKAIRNLVSVVGRGQRFSIEVTEKN